MALVKKTKNCVECCVTNKNRKLKEEESLVAAFPVQFSHINRCCFISEKCINNMILSFNLHVRKVGRKEMNAGADEPPVERF